MSFSDIKAVIFDCDGVLFNTTRANTIYYNRLLNRFGLPDMTPEQFAFVHMQTVGVSMKYLFEETEHLEAAEAARREMGYWDLIPEMEMEPDLKPLLDLLRPRRRTAVATNRTDTMGKVIEVHGLSGRFDMVVTSLDVDRPKPAPDMLGKILDTFSLSSCQAVYVGDSEVDESAASAADMPFIAFRNRTLKTAAAHVDRLSSIAGLLDPPQAR
ncbi:MAG: HAD family hydrolase [Desulfobacterales bacterium]|jgi:phosphoglycolate phosphatase-like HAD superfamily hydrolase